MNLPPRLQEAKLEGAPAAGAVAQRKLGAGTRSLIFLMPLVAALNPILPEIGPISALPVLAALLFLASLMNARGQGGRSALRVFAVLFSASLLVIAAVTLLTRYGAEWVHNEAVAVGSGSLLVLSVCVMRVTLEVVRLLCNGWLLTVLVTGGFAIFEIVTGTRVGASYLDVNPLVSDVGIVSVFFNPNNYAAFLALSLPLLVAGEALAQSTAARLWYRVALLATLPLMLATGSRFGLAALILFIAIWIILRLRKPLTRAIVGLFTIVVVTGMITIANTSLNDYWGDVAYSVPVLGINVPVDSSLFARWNLALDGWDLLSANPFFGVGPGGFEIGAQSTGSTRLVFGIINPHNGFVELATQYGLVILALGIAVTISMLSIARRVRRAMGSPAEDRTLAFALISAILMLPLVLLMNSSYLEILHTWAVLAVFVAIGIYLSTQSPSREIEPEG